MADLIPFACSRARPEALSSTFAEGEALPSKFSPASSAMENDSPTYATLGEIAERLGRDKSSARKLLLKLAPALGIEVSKVRLAEARGQPSLTMRREDADRFVDAARQGGYVVKDSISASVVPSTAWGNLYLIQLVPDLSERRIKIGYATSLSQRLADHRTASPTATLTRSWQCRPVWELAAIASITRVGCTPLSQEVFDCDDLAALIERADAFFNLMPKPAGDE